MGAISIKLHDCSIRVFRAFGACTGQILKVYDR